MFTTASIYGGLFPAGNLVLLQQNDSNRNSSMYSVAAVPEPTSALLLVSPAAVCVCAGRIRRLIIPAAVVLLFVPGFGHAAILVMPGDFIEYFGLPPAATDWSTKVGGVGAGSAAITDNATMDLPVQQLSAAGIGAALPSTTTGSWGVYRVRTGPTKLQY